jgi:type IV secretory pathway TraG/TraD family ATPase VirD4
MVGNTFASLADPRVLAAVSPTRGQEFDPATFLRRGGTLYLLGTASGASGSANLVAGLVEDVLETARKIAASSPHARLDPPLSLILDEAANYPLPSLLPLMSEGGGSGISALLALQSLAQARARWGSDEAAALWDAATIKLVLGGSSNANDLRDLSELLGTKPEKRVSRSSDGGGRRSTTTSLVDVPLYAPNTIRTLPFGRAVLLYRSIPPVNLHLMPWTSRRESRDLQADRQQTEGCLRDYATGNRRGG